MKAMANAKFTPNIPHFFKPLLPGFHHHLSIPRSFFKYLKGQNNCEIAVLRSCGRTWTVKINDRRFEDHGWEEFVRDHDLHVGDFLVFRHGGNMVFDVLVFDTSCCQREYPQFAATEVKDQNKSSASAKEPGILEQPDKRTSTSCTVKHPYFVATLRPGCMKAFRQWIPKGFAKSNGLNNRFCKMTIVDQQGKSWIADLRCVKANGQVYIGSGWRDICIANNLKEKDEILLELIENGKRPIFNLHRVLDTDSGACHREYPQFAAEVKDQNKSSAQEPAKQFGSKIKQLEKRTSTSFTIEHPYFVATLTPAGCMKRSRQYIPKRFAESNGLNNRFCEMILIDQQGRSWTACLRHKKADGQVYIGSGWKDICIANNLKEKDQILLELIGNGKKPIFNLHRLDSESSAKDKAKTNYTNSEAGCSLSTQLTAVKDEALDNELL